SDLLGRKEILPVDARTRFVVILTEELKAGQQVQLPQSFEDQLRHYADAIKPLLQQRNDIVKLASRGLLVTMDWTVVRDPNVPDLSTITGVVETSIGPSRRHDLTANVAASFFNSTPHA